MNPSPTPPVIGVFDSGVGGKNVVDAITREFPGSKIILLQDRKNLPYGNKTKEELNTLMVRFMNIFQKERVEAVVIACNSVSTNLLPELKEMISVPVVGFVPAVKPAAELTKTGVITVCATPSTLGSDRYKELKRLYASGISVLEPDCSDWARLIEDDELSDERLRQIIETSREAKSDVIVLGCTHYHWIDKRINYLSGAGIKIIQPTKSVTDELRRVLELR